MSHAPEITDLIIEENKKLKDVLLVIDKSAQGICFVVNINKKLVGVITDGDVRRALLKGLNLENTVKEVMKSDFVSLPISASNEVIQKTLSSKITHIPLIDENGVPVDYASLRRLRRIPIMEPFLGGNELAYVTECIQTNWISSQGRFVKLFEESIAKFCDVPYAVAVSNGTVALHLALEALGIGEGDEVIVPNLTFAASINTVLHAKATPVIVDIDKDSWNMSIEKLKGSITNKTRAIMPVHLYGLPCEMEQIMTIANEHNLIVIEDCAEALGSREKGKHVGGFGDAGCFSFFGNKTVTTGEGGMILFRDKKVHEKALILRDHGMSKERKYWHDYVGYNYRMTNLQAAIGYAQMERIEEIVAKKIWIGETYNSFLKDCQEIIIPEQNVNVTNSYWLYTIIIKNDLTLSRDEVLQKMLMNGIEGRPVFYPLSSMPVYASFSNDDTIVSQEISRQGLSLPSSINLEKEEIEHICKVVISILNNKKMLQPSV